MDWLSSLPATGITAVTLVVAVFILQSRGALYFKPQVDEIRAAAEKRVSEIREDAQARIAEARADRDARLADRDREIASKDREIAAWREAYTVAETGRRVASDQVTELLGGVEATVQVVKAIPGGGDSA